jgi:arylsulfatase A-like enzyme
MIDVRLWHPALSEADGVEVASVETWAMIHRTMVPILCCCLIWLLLGGWAAGDPRPNLVLFVVDDLPEELCNFAGGDPARNLSPTIDRLAGEGMVLTRMHSPSPICTPSRFAILTGRYPSRSTAAGFRQEAERYGQTVVRFDTLIGPNDETLPRQLRRIGYATGAVGKNHVVEAAAYQRMPYAASIESPEARETLDRNAQVLQAAFHRVGFDFAERLYFGNPDADGVRPLAAHNQDWITEGAIDFIHQAHDGPFFLYVATTVPHGPVEDERSWNADRRITPDGILPHPPRLHSPPATIARRIAAAGLSGSRRKTLLWLDDAIASLMTALEATGQLENTILVFVSDHGTRGKGSLYERGTHTPCFIWRSGGFGRQELPTSASLIDLAPTLLEWAGADVAPGDVDGRSLVPAIEGRVEEIHESLYFELGFSRAVERQGLKYLAVRYPPEVRTMPPEGRAHILEAHNAWLTMRGRPIATTDPMAAFSHLSVIPGGNDAEQVSMRGYPAYASPDQLYDLHADPREQRNLFDDPTWAQSRTELRRLLHDHVSELNDRFGEFGTADFEP